MPRIMYVCGIALAAIGLALAIVGLASPGQMQIYGLTLETAAILITGGILSLGLAGVMQALASLPAVSTATSLPSQQISNRLGLDTRDELPAFRPRMPDITAAAAAAAAATSQMQSEAPAAMSKVSVQETIEALEQAKSDIKAALGGAENFDDKPDTPLPVKLEVPEPAIPPLPEPEAPVAEEAAEPAGEPGLFVVEEQTVRGRPARLLSDGTVEAETEEGWMRFENMEHLNEYLDSVVAS
jgi:hypothetical protein